MLHKRARAHVLMCVCVCLCLCVCVCVCLCIKVTAGRAQQPTKHTCGPSASVLPQLRHHTHTHTHTHSSVTHNTHLRSATYRGHRTSVAVGGAARIIPHPPQYTAVRPIAANRRGSILLAQRRCGNTRTRSPRRGPGLPVRLAATRSRGVAQDKMKVLDQKLRKVVRVPRWVSAHVCAALMTPAPPAAGHQNRCSSARGRALGCGGVLRHGRGQHAGGSTGTTERA